MKKVLFIDRDGTLALEPEDYQLDALTKLEFYPKVFTYLGKIVKELDYSLVMVTNQDGLGTKSFPEDDFWPTHNFLLKAFENEGIVFDEILIDKSFPEDNAPTRKPRTGLLTHYINGDFDLKQSYVIGDRLTDMELANASLYDGATSIAEAISVAINKTKRDEVVISSGLNPNSKKVINTLIDRNKFNLDYVDLEDYLFPANFEFDESQAAFVVSYPHYEGSCQDLTLLVERAKEKGLVTICYVDPSMLGILTTPGQMGFDIIVAEGQSLGSPLSFGGPTVGWFATKKEFARLVPGRLIGESRDKDGNKSYVMTLRAREQDIRREKASSNICTNQTLNAIGSAIHLSWLGPEGIFEMGYHAVQKANYMRKQLIKKGYKIPNDDSSLREFLLEVKSNSADVINKMGDKGFLAGILYDEKHILVAVTEKRKKTEIDNYIESLVEVDNG